MKINKIFKITLVIMFIITISFTNNYTLKALEKENDLSDLNAIVVETTNKLFGNLPISSMEYLYNLDESPDYIYVEFVEGGYVIYNSQTLDVLEYSLSSTLEYSLLNKKYYAGPNNYITKIDGSFVNIREGYKYSSDQAE